MIIKLLLMVVAGLVVIGIPSKSVADAKHWPDFSCHPSQDNKLHRNSIKFYRMGWNSCKSSFERTKQRCDKMCILMNRFIVKRPNKNDPFTFDINAFVALMLDELGYEDEHAKDAPLELVNRVKGKLEICRANYREYETMKNFNNLPCEPYVGLFQCVHNATECKGEF